MGYKNVPVVMGVMGIIKSPPFQCALLTFFLLTAFWLQNVDYVIWWPSYLLSGWILDGYNYVFESGRTPPAALLSWNALSLQKVKTIGWTRNYITIFNASLSTMVFFTINKYWKQRIRRKQYEEEVIEGFKEIKVEELAWRLRWECAGKTEHTTPTGLMRFLYENNIIPLGTKNQGAKFYHGEMTKWFCFGKKNLDMYLPKKIETMSFLVMGAAGSGKTSGFIDTVLESVLARGDKVILFDYKGDFVERLMGRENVHLLAPWDARSIRVSIGNECKSTADAELITAAAIKPNPQSKDPFWDKAAQAVLSSVFKGLRADNALEPVKLREPGKEIQVPTPEGIITYLTEPGDTAEKIAKKFNTSINELRTLNNALTWDNLFKALTNMEYMQSLIESTVSGLMANNYVESQSEKSASILSIVKQNMSWVPEVVMSWGNMYFSSIFKAGNTVKVPCEGSNEVRYYEVQSDDTIEDIAEMFGTTSEKLKRLNEQPIFNLRRWVSDDNQKGTLIFKYSEGRPLLSDSIITIFLQLVIAEFLTIGEPKDGNERRVWFFLDELPQLPKLGNLAKLLQAGRSFGGCVVVGTQDIAGLEEKYGKEATQVITNNLNTSIIYRLNDPAAAEWASKKLGNYIERAHKTSLSRGEFEVAGSSSTSVEKQTKNVVEMGQLQTLPTAPQDHSAVGYIKIVGRHPVAKGRFLQGGRLPKISPAEIEAEWIEDSGEKIPEDILNSLRENPAAAQDTQSSPAPEQQSSPPAATPPVYDEKTATPASENGYNEQQEAAELDTLLHEYEPEEQFFTPGELTEALSEAGGPHIDFTGSRPSLPTESLLEANAPGNVNLGTVILGDSDDSESFDPDPDPSTATLPSTGAMALVEDPDPVAPSQPTPTPTPTFDPNDAASLPAVALSALPNLATCPPEQRELAFDFAARFGQLDYLVSCLDALYDYLTEEIQQLEHKAMMAVFDESTNHRLVELTQQRDTIQRTRDLTKEAIMIFGDVKATGKEFYKIAVEDEVLL